MNYTLVSQSSQAIIYLAPQFSPIRRSPSAKNANVVQLCRTGSAFVAAIDIRLQDLLVGTRKVDLELTICLPPGNSLSRAAYIWLLTVYRFLALFYKEISEIS